MFASLLIWLLRAVPVTARGVAVSSVDAQESGQQLMRSETAARRKRQAAGEVLAPSGPDEWPPGSDMVTAEISSGASIRLAESLAEAGATGVSASTGVHASEGCTDLVETGIRFKTGEQAHCADLVNYCVDPTMGTKVRAACAKTCDQCNLTVVAPLPCTDLPRDAVPVITFDGVLKECSDLKNFCTNHVDSVAVQRKCRMTCNTCPPPPKAIEAIKGDSSSSPIEAIKGDNSSAINGSNSSTINGSNSSTINGVNSSTIKDGSLDLKAGQDLSTTGQPYTTLSWTFSTMIEDKPSEETRLSGCSRRRRWGFCYSRRRRWQ